MRACPGCDTFFIGNVKQMINWRKMRVQNQGKLDKAANPTIFVNRNWQADQSLFLLDCGLGPPWEAWKQLWSRSWPGYRPEPCWQCDPARVWPWDDSRFARDKEQSVRQDWVASRHFSTTFWNFIPFFKGRRSLETKEISDCPCFLQRPHDSHARGSQGQSWGWLWVMVCWDQGIWFREIYSQLFIGLRQNICKKHNPHILWWGCLRSQAEDFRKDRFRRYYSASAVGDAHCRSYLWGDGITGVMQQVQNGKSTL